MQTTIPCPSCQRELRLPEYLLGKLVKCPVCGMTFTASLEPPAVIREPIQPAGRSNPSPTLEDYPEESPDWNQEDYEDRPPRRRPRRTRYFTPHRGGAILTLGILSIVICGLLGPIAWIMGNTDLSEMRAGRMDPDGESVTQAGKICGIVGTVRALCCWGLFCLAILGRRIH